MKKATLLVAFSCLLSACTIHVTPESIFREDKEHPPLAVEKLQNAVPGGQLEPLAMAHADGSVSRGVRLTKPGSKAVIVYLTSNKIRLNDRGPELLARFALLNADVIWVEYRGWGTSDGQPTVENLQSDVGAVLGLAAEAKKPVILHGLSMGSLLAGRAAQDPRVAALVLEGGISSIPQVAEATIPSWLRPFVDVDVDPLLLSFDNTKIVADYRRPLLLLVGSRDDETPPVIAHQLFDAAQGSAKTLVIAPDKTHLDAMTADVSIDAYRRLIAQLP